MSYFGPHHYLTSTVHTGTERTFWKYFFGNSVNYFMSRWRMQVELSSTKRIWHKCPKFQCTWSVTNCNLATRWRGRNLPVPGLLAFIANFSNLWQAVHICISNRLEWISDLHWGWMMILSNLKVKKSVINSSSFPATTPLGLNLFERWTWRILVNIHNCVFLPSTSATAFAQIFAS